MKAQYRVPVILVAFLIFFLLYIAIVLPWERIALLEDVSNVTVRLYDCKTLLAIPKAYVTIKNDFENVTFSDENGEVRFSTLPDCITVTAEKNGIKVSKRICVAGGEEKTVLMCMNVSDISSLLFSKTNIGIIGATHGETLTSYNLGNAILSYPRLAALNTPSA